MRRTFSSILVCLLFLAITNSISLAQSRSFIDVIVKPPLYNSFSSQIGQKANIFPLTTTAAASIQPAGQLFKQAAAPVSSPGCTAELCPMPKRIAKCKPAVDSPLCSGTMGTFCGPPVKCAPPVCEPLCPDCILPKRCVGQFELAAQFFYARVKGTVRWPAVVNGQPASELDFNDDFGLSEHWLIPEFSARYQLAPRWTLYYSIMSFEMEAAYIPNRSYNFGVWTIIANTTTKTRWQFLYQRMGLLYSPICTPWAVVSLFSYWTLNDQRLTVWNEVCVGHGAVVDRTRSMIMSGMELQKCIQTLCNGGTLSCDNKVGIGYLDNTLILDVQTGLQFSVPLNCGRWGYTKAGYRYMNFKEDRDDLRLDSSFEGGFLEFGLIF